MNILFQLSALAYTILITIVFFVKKKNNTLENYIYRGILVVTYIEILLDISANMLNTFYPETILTTVITRFSVCSEVTWMMVFTFYLFALTSSKNDGKVLQGNGKNFKYFQTSLILCIINIAILDIAMFLLPIEITVHETYIDISGGMNIAKYISIGVCIFIIWGFLIINRANIKNKKYNPVFMFILLITVVVAMPYKPAAFPEFLTVSSLVTMIIYFTIENPDLKLIEQLSIAKTQAESANRAKTDFLSSMSHEIRTPLNAIVGFSQALAKEDISGAAKEEVKDILMASNSLLETVNGILDVSKIEANKVELVNLDYGTIALINDVVTTINSRMGSKPLEFKVEVDDKLPPVLTGDAMRLKQILINLLSNSVKYTKEGYIKLRIQCINEDNNCHMVIDVEDTGIGMKEESIKLLFTKFQRFDMERNVNIEGTGLGMAITKGLVELMNGQIRVKSEYGKGTTFTVELDQTISTTPVEDLKVEEKEITFTPFKATGQKVLVVDDNKINLKVASRLLREYDLTVELVDNGADCINRILDGKTYDLIFLDIMMPKMKGPEVLNNLKSIVGFNMPVVALTADVISGMEEKYISQGFDDCLPKPIVEEDLYYVLKKFLREVEGTENYNQITPEIAEPRNQNILIEAGINVNQGLELLKDIEMYDMTITEFFEELDNKVSRLNQYRNEENVEDYTTLVHALKSEASYIGCNKFASIAEEHEECGKNHDLETINAKFPELKYESIKLHDVIKKYLNR